jgi:hypothetical protein
MRVGTRIALAAGLIGAAAIGSTAVVSAQYYYPPPGYGPPPYGYGYGYSRRTWNGCPPGYTVQGGVCQPYRGPAGGGWRTWNGCPPAIRSRVASASRIGATRPLKSFPTVAAPGGAQIKETLLKGPSQNSRRDFATRSSHCGSAFNGWLATRLAAQRGVLKIRGIASHRAGSKVSSEMGRSTSPPRVELA